MAESTPGIMDPNNHGLGIQQRPTSALDGPANVYDYLGSQMPNPEDPLTASLKSVFDCDLGCFVNKEDEQAEGDHQPQKIHHQSDLDPHDV